MTELHFDGHAARFAGGRVVRIEDPRLLTGRGTYVDDVTLPRMLHACFVRSPLARAAIRGIDTAAARAVPGVRHVLTAEDLNPRVKEPPYRTLIPGSAETPCPPLAEGEVRFVGDPVALVIAASRPLAEDAADLVVVDYERLPPVVDYTASERSDNLVYDTLDSNVIGCVESPPNTAVDDDVRHRGPRRRARQSANKHESGADGGSRHRRRLHGRDRRAHDLLVHAGTT